jgi:hypothetical protein
MGELEQQTSRLTLTLRGRAPVRDAFPRLKGLGGQILAEEFQFFICIERLCRLVRNQVLCALLFPPWS